MSLRDTIEGARREAEGNAVGRPKKEAEAVAAESDEKRGFSRSSAAKAKPAREAAASVRTGSASSSKPSIFGDKNESKEEKRERKRKEREESDLRNRAYDLVLRSMPDYRRTERVFWIMVGVGMALAVISLVCVYLYGETTNMSTWQGALSMGTLVGAYVCIIAAIIYDFVKRRPFRKQVQARVNGLTDKKLADLLEEERARQIAEKAAKDARKGKK